MRTPLIALLAIGLAGCGNVSWSSDDDTPGIVGSGSGDTRSYAADGFTGVALAGSQRVDVRVGPAFSVRAQGSDAALGVLRIRRDGSNLVIDQRSGFHLNGEAAHVTVTMPRIAEASLGGSGDLTIDRVSGERFSANAAGSGSVRIGTLATQRTDFNLAGSSSVAASGSAGELHVAIAGSGDVSGAQLTASHATVSIAGSGNVTAAVSGDANVQIMGSGDVNLGPQAHCSVTRMGAGTVTCGSGGGDAADATGNEADD